MFCHWFWSSNIRTDWLAPVGCPPCRSVQRGRRLVLLRFSNVPVRCEARWQSCVLHSHSTVSRVVVETTWEGAEHNTGLERTKPHVFCQDKWPSGSYTTRVASGRGFLLLILLYGTPPLPPASLSTCIKIMVHQDTW